MCFFGGGGGAPQQSPGPYEKKLVELAGRRMDDYESVYQPMEQEMLAEAKKYEKPWFAAEQADIATAASRQPRESVLPGVGPGLKQALFNSQMASRFGSGFGAGNGDVLARQQGSAYKTGLAQAGRQQARTASSTYGSLAASEAGQRAAAQNAEYQRSQATYGALGTLAGTGAGYWLARDHSPERFPFYQEREVASPSPDVLAWNGHTPRFGMYS